MEPQGIGSRICYIKNLNLTNLWKNNQIVCYIEGWLIIIIFNYCYFILFFFLWCDVTLPSTLGLEQLMYFNVYMKLQYTVQVCS